MTSRFLDDRRADTLAVAAIVWSAFLFGTSFVVVKGAFDDIDPVPYLAIRFTLAGAVLGVLGLRRPGRPGEVRAGVLTGITYFFGFLGQTVGLQHTTAAASAFLTYLLIVVVPIVSFAWLHHRPTGAQLASILVALAGLVLLTGKGVGFGRGEVLTLAGAVSFSVHLVQMGVYARFDPFRFNAVQALTVAVPSLVLAPFTGGLPSSGAGWGVAAYAALIVTVGTFLPWSWAARRLPPTRTALLFLLEPVFATAAAYLDGERLSAAAAAGAALILAAAATSELGGRRAVVSRDRPRGS